MKLSIDPRAVEGRRRELRSLLVGRAIIYPVLAYGLLGHDPNEMGIEDQIAICDDLRALGYERRPRLHPYSHGHLMNYWLRETDWPEDVNGTEPYWGIPLKPDPDLENWDEV